MNVLSHTVPLNLCYIFLTNLLCNYEEIVKRKDSAVLYNVSRKVMKSHGVVS